MRIDRPLWAEGIHLAPQHLQQQARVAAWATECVARLAHLHPWGVQAAEFDPEALKLGTLKAEHLCVRLADGSLLDTARTDPLPPAMALAGLAEDSAEVLLALPLEHANGGNCQLQGQTPPLPTRYRQAWKPVQDLYGENTVDMAVLEPQLTLRLAGGANADYLTCPVARVIRDGHGAWALDPTFVPPLLSFAAHPGLCQQLGHLLNQLHAKRERLMGLRRESNQRMADFAVADVSLFWLLNALNTYQPILAGLLAQPQRHPEAVYQEMAKLAGSLLTFSLEHDLGAIPPYDHARPQAVFPPLMGLLSNLLEASLPSRVVALELARAQPHRWQARLEDPRLREPGGLDLYLSVRSALPLAQVQQQVPVLCKVAAPDDLDRLVNSALDGVPLMPLAYVPAALPLRLEHQYFHLKLDTPQGHALVAAGGCAIYVPSRLAEAQLELFAVLRT